MPSTPKTSPTVPTETNQIEQASTSHVARNKTPESPPNGKMQVQPVFRGPTDDYLESMEDVL
jgi:hypothetical protein